MDRKGFTLIELIAVVVLLGIILVFAAPRLVNVYKDSKLKMEGVFLEELARNIDSYITLNSGSIEFNSSFDAKIIDDTTNKEDDVTVKMGTISVKNIINDGIINESDYVNPGNKDIKCNTNAVVYVYKDSNFVYCYKVSKYINNKQNLGCLTDEYINSIKDDYVLDSCVWTLKEKEE